MNNIGEALKAVADIMGVFKGAKDIKSIKLARRSLKKLKRQLAKDGWEEWESEMFDDLVKSYGKQLKRLMTGQKKMTTNILNYD